MYLYMEKLVYDIMSLKYNIEIQEFTRKLMNQCVDVGFLFFILRSQLIYLYFLIKIKVLEKKTFCNISLILL